MTVFGVDCSDFDWSRGPMDLVSMARDGISFLTHKATEGTKNRHAHYGTVLTRARSAGIPVLGAYLVVRTPGSAGHGSVAAQVTYFLSYLDSATPWWRTHPHFILQVDLEHWSYDAVAAAHGVAACDILKAETGKTVVLYAPRWAYGNGIGGAHPLWASDYGSNIFGHYLLAYPGDASVRWGAYSGRAPVILQFGSRLTIGSQPGMDANAFRGSLDELLTFASGGSSGQAVTESAAGFAAQSAATTTAQEDDDVHETLKAGENTVFTNRATLGGKGWLHLSAAFGDCDVRVARYTAGWTDAGTQHVTVKDAGGHWSLALDAAAGEKVTVTNNGPGLLAVDTAADRPWS